MKNLTIKLEEADWQKFKKACKDRGGNASVVLRQYIKDYISDYKEKK